MSTLSQRLPADRRFEFSSEACAPDTFAVVRMNGVEAISRPYRFELVLVSDDARIDLAKVLGAAATLRILAPDDAARATPYAGMLAEFDQLHQAGGFTFYRAVLVPRLWQLALYRNSEVYLHEQTIPEIIEGILKSARLSPGRDYALQLKGHYRPRSYVCQYQETPLAFVSRWLEREGIYYHFEQVDGIDKLVLIDDKLGQPAQVVTVNYRPADELDVGLAPDSVRGFVCRTRMLPRTLVLKDYNHRRASLPLEVTAEVSASGLGEEMLYGENFRTLEEGQRYADIRAQELRCGARVFNGEATAVGLRSGSFMDLSHHYREDFNGRYLVTEITHEGSQAGALLAGLKTPFNANDGQTTFYRNNFVALPAATQFRPARTTPKPRVAGTMNASIDAEGSGQYAELDAYGQYKVQIPFDRTEKGAAKGSAPVRMASPYAGSDHGMHFPLHKGAEVLLSFTDGDPDQPVIVGAVPNSVNPNVVDQRNPHDNLISTKGGNQLLMSDTAGKEVIWLNSPFHQSSIGVGSILPEGGGSIFAATKGGSDSVSFGANNSMAFGSTNSLSLASNASVSASFNNSVSWGTSIDISASNAVKWNMNALPLGALKSLSIDDSDSIKLSKTFGGTSTGTATIAAGALSLDPSNVDLTNWLRGLRGLIALYTAVNFTQSTVFAMAVNSSDDGKVLNDHDKKGKADEDAADKKWTEDQAAAKAQEKADLKPPANEPDPAKWRKDEEARIDAKYDLAAKEQASPMNRDGLHGWKGILGKFGVNALANVGAMAALQGVARILAAKIDALKVVSKMELGETGITQTVNGAEAPAPLIGIAGAPEMKVRSEISMSHEAGNGIKLKAADKSKWDDEPKDFTDGVITLESKLIRLTGGGVVKLDAPVSNMGHDNGTDFVGFSHSRATDVAKLSSSGARVAAEGTTVELNAARIEIGDKGKVSLLNAEMQAAAAALTIAEGLKTAAEGALTVAQTAREVAKQLPDWNPLEGDKGVEEAFKAVRKADQVVNEAQAKLAAATTAVNDFPFIDGLTIDGTAATLAFGAAAWKATNAGLAIKFGPATADFKAAGLSLDGTTIQLG